MRRPSKVETFIHEGTQYSHFLFFSEDDRVELQNKQGDCLLIFTFSGGIVVPGANKTLIGRIRRKDKTWVSTVEGQPELTDKDLLKLEVMVSKQYLSSLS